jgi:hypothetical protein
MDWTVPPSARTAFAGAWNLDNTEAVGAVQWLIAKVVVAVENSESPIADACLIGGGQRVANLPIEAADRDGRPWSRSGDNAADWWRASGHRG